MKRRHDEILQAVEAVLTCDKNDERVTAMKEVCAMYVRKIPVSIEHHLDCVFLESRLIDSVEKCGCIINGQFYKLSPAQYQEYSLADCESFVLKNQGVTDTFALVERWVSTLFDNLPLPDCILSIVYGFARHYHQ